jgi:type IV pilus assembly protein PilB
MNETRPQKSSAGHRKLGEFLLEARVITSAQLAKGLDRINEADGRHSRLGEALVDLGFASEPDIAQALGAQLGLPYTDFDSALVEPDALDLINENFATKHKVIPLRLTKNALTIAIADPLDYETIQDIGFLTGRNLKLTVATPTEILGAIERYYHLSVPIDELLTDMSPAYIEVISSSEENTQDLEASARKGDSPPIIRMVNSIIYNAVKNRSSDIHIEPREKIVIVRERMDGMLHDVLHIPKWVQGAVTSRIKVVAGLDISEKRIPQDGRIKIRMEGREIDLRISTLPIQYGESVVIRILDTQAAILKLADVGLCEDTYGRVCSIVERPQGIVLVTGPTGSGKTSTLYAMINHIKKESINIISLEDPIEYELGDVNQVAINEKTGMTFAHGLRSILRQDPDVILVGEMRDLETAEIAVKSSLTGHLVLSSLHTNTAAAAITRLRDIGVEPYLIASSLNGIIAQRLLRRLCIRCRVQYEPTGDELKRLGLTKADCAGLTLYRSGGCKYCNNTGYRGRTATFEVLVCDDNVRNMIAEGESEEKILEAALKAGMVHMSEDGLKKIKSGITSLDELTRVIHMEVHATTVCPSCGHTLKKDFHTCPFCGYCMVDKCQKHDCNRYRDPSWKFCPFCEVEFDKSGRGENGKISTH